MEEKVKKHIRVLHIISSFNVGGVETWLLNVVRNLPASNYQFDFFAISPEEAAFDNEIVSLGCKIFKAKKSRPSFFSMYSDLKKVIRENGHYDAIHSHVHHFSGIVVLVGYILGVPVRIVHSHTDTRVKEYSGSTLRRAYVGLMRILVRLFATSGIGTSSNAAEDQFGVNWAKDQRWKILPCGIDFRRFDIPKDDLLPLSLGIYAGVKVIGHIGRFNQPKNHFFLIDVFKKLLDRGNNVVLVLVGAGDLKKAIEDRVNSLGLSDRVTFLGIRRDVPNILRSVIDVFLFPSLYEGLPLAFIEAQLAGCYCVGSDILPKEVILDTRSVTLLGLKEPLDTWANKVEDFLSCSKMKDSEIILSQYRNSDYELKTNVKRLLSFYYNRVNQI